MAGISVPPNRGAEQIKRLLGSPEICDLMADLEATRWTGRPGYPIRTMVGMVLAKSLYVLPTWTRTVALVTEHSALRSAIGGGVPSVDACYRFTRKLREHKTLLDTAVAQVILSLREQLPEYGENIAIDGSDLPAYANGQRFVSKGGKPRGAVLGPRRFVGPPFGYLHPQGWRVLRLQDSRCRLHDHRASRRLGNPHSEGRRGSGRPRAARRHAGQRVQADDVRHG